MSRLETLKEDLRAKQLRDIAIWIVKYQKFKMNIALDKLDTDFCRKKKKKNYFVRGLKYLRTKEKSSGVNSVLYDFIEEEIQKHTQPLRPNFSEQKREYKRDYTKKDAKPPIVALKAVQKPLTANFEYGIRIGNDIKILESEDIAKGFIQGLKFAGNNNAILVGVEVQNL